MACRVRIKICGITNCMDAAHAAYSGAWALGFVFSKKSPRYISPSKARKIIGGLPPFVTPVGVFVNHKERDVRDICKTAQIHTVQFHGEEEVAYCKRFEDYKIIKAFRVGRTFDIRQVTKYKVDAYLFDTFQEGVPGGTGKSFNWEMIKGIKLNRPVILSGGLNSRNVRKALHIVNPYAVDVSSGVEAFPGKKSPNRIKTFFDQVNLAGSISEDEVRRY
jgi:phosphoribosylanthranilate isomerase